MESRDAGTDGGEAAAAAAAGLPGPVSQAPREGGNQEPRRVSSLINWKRPCRTSALLAAANTVFWFVALSPLRVSSLVALSLAVVVATVTARDLARSRPTGAHLWRSMTGSWEIIDSGQDSRSGIGPHLCDSFKLFLQEMSSFKQQNPGKFCLLVCSLCTFFAVLGRYIPGIAISYILVLSIFLWPLVSSHEFRLWLEPVLQKLDFGIGEFLQKIKENHEKRVVQAQAEKECIEADLSSMFPKLDSTACREMSVSDTEVSDVTWTDNGTFNLSEGHTPQTENSEDLDREEAFTGGLPEFPSLDNGNGDDDDDLSIGLPALHFQPQQPITSKHTPPCKHQPIDNALELVNQMAANVIATAVTAAIQERIEAAVGITAAAAEDPGRSRLPESARLLPLELAEESDSEVEDFELLDQSELEQLEGELGLGEKEAAAATAEEEAPAKTSKSSSAGFFSKILGRH